MCVHLASRCVCVNDYYYYASDDALVKKEREEGKQTEKGILATVPLAVIYMSSCVLSGTNSARVSEVGARLSLQREHLSLCTIA